MSQYDPYMAQPDRPWLKSKDAATALGVPHNAVTRAVRKRQIEGFIYRTPRGAQKVMVYTDQMEQAPAILSQMKPGPDWKAHAAQLEREGRAHDRRQAILRGDVLPGKAH